MIRASFAAKALSIIFFIAMMLSIAPLAWAESSGGFEYTVLDGKATITKYTGTSAVVVIPSEINGYPVEAIGDSAFYPNAANLVTSVTIPDSVSSIGAQAFYQCGRLSSVTIPNSVTSIGNGAFQDCRSLRSVYLPESLESIGEKTFYTCINLESVNIPDSVTTIGRAAFYDCSSLKALILPRGLTTIEQSAFYSCTSLHSVIIPDSVTNIGGGAFDWCTGLSVVTIPESVTSIGDDAFHAISYVSRIYVLSEYTANLLQGKYTVDRTKVVIRESLMPFEYSVTDNQVTITNYFGNDEGVTVPETIEGYPVTSIGERAFQECASIVSVVIPNTVSDISDRAFINCSALTSVTIPDSVTSIGQYAFWNLASPSTIFVPSEEIAALLQGTYDASKTSVEVIEPHVHNFIISEKQEATCVVDGWVKYQCDGCDESFLEEIPALGHTEAVDSAISPTCTESGLGEGAHCSVCGEVLTPQDVVPALGHALIGHDAVPATCEHAGSIPYWSCSRCGRWFFDSEGTDLIVDHSVITTDPIAHAWDDGAVTTEPTYDSEGVMTYTCLSCGATRTEAIPKIDDEPFRTDGTAYRIVSRSDPAFILDVAEVQPTAGSNVSIWTSNGGHNQLFTFEIAPDGNVIMRNVANNELVLDAAGAIPKVGANVSTWTYNKGKNQEWVVQPTDEGFYTIASAVNKEYVLDAVGAVPEIGANVGLWYYNGGMNQQWRFVPANDLEYAEINAIGLDRNATGLPLSPDITVTLNGRTLVEGTDYVIKFDDSEEKPFEIGSYAVSIVGKGRCSGSHAIGEFIIHPAPIEKDSTIPYHIVSGFSDDFVLDVAEAIPTIGANVSIWIDNGGENQLFTLELQDDGFYVLRNVANEELVLDAAGAIPSVGANVSTWSYNEGMNQKWVLIPSDTMPGYFRIASASNTTFVLDAAGAAPEIGANVSIWIDNDGYNQLWKLVSPHDVPAIPEGIGEAYRIGLATDPSIVLEMTELAAGANVSVWTTGDSAKQVFFIERADDGYVVFRNVSNPELVIEAKDSSPTAGANIVVGVYDDELNQKWLCNRTDNGFIAIASAANPDLVLDCAGAVPEAGANVSLWTINGGMNQMWQIMPLE